MSSIASEVLEERVLLTVEFQIPSPPAAGPSFNGSQFVDLSPGQSVFDLDLFEQNVRNNFIDNSVGFAYSINYQGQIGARHDGYGDARMAGDPDADDPQKDFTEDTRMTIASVAKTITATAMLKLIQDQGLSVDDPIAPYLPTFWTLGPGVAPSGTDGGITFRDLLTHGSGIRRIDFDGSASDGQGPDWNGDGFDDDGASLGEQTSYAGLQQLIALGITDTSDNDGNGQIDLKEQFSYENANFALMRVMLPYVWDEVDYNAVLESLPGQDILTAATYRFYVQTRVLQPMGIEEADTKTTEEFPTRNYPFPDDGSNSIEYRDRSLLAGGEGWFLSADELATLLHHVRYENTVLNQTSRQLMSDAFLGWHDPLNSYGFAQGMFGTYFSHGGDLNNLNTTIMSFPNTAQVAILLNSDYIGADVPHADAYNGFYQAALMKRAFENAWPEIAINGTTGDDTFKLRRNENDNNSVDILLNGNLLVTRWIETLDRLTINGIAGDDEFIIDDLPVSLELHLNGGADDDTFFIGDGDLDGTIRGDVVLDGGTGHDSLYLDDTLDLNFDLHTPLPPGVPDFYFLTDNSVSKFGFGVDYDELEHIELQASQQNSIINVLSTAAGTRNEIRANNGIDVFQIGGGDFDSNILGDLFIHGGFHSDNVLIDDSEDVGSDTHSFGKSTYTKSSASAKFDFEFVQQVRLDTGSNDDTVDVFSTYDLDELIINTNGGEDTVNVHFVDELSEVFVNTGGANDTVELSPTVRSLNAINGVVRVDMGGGFFDELLLNDHNDPEDDKTYNLWRRRFDADGFGHLFFDNTEPVELRANDGDNRVNVRRLHEDVRLTVHGRGGNDEVIAGFITNDLDTHLLGDLTVDGGDGTDLLQLNDRLDVGNDSYQFSLNSFTKTGLDSWTYLEIEELVLNASDADNAVNLGSVVPVELTINARDGNDTINVGSGRADLMRASVHVSGSAGSDRININNQDAPGDRTYTFAGQTFDMTAALFGSVSYTSIAEVVLNAADTDDTIHLNSSALSTAIKLFGNGGDDTFNIGAGDLDPVGGDVIAHGGAGMDVASVFDQNDAGDEDYTVTSEAVSKDNFLLQYNGMEKLHLFANSDRNTINIESVLQTTPVSVDAGDGPDAIHLAPTTQDLTAIQGPVFVNGSGGVDNVLLHDEANAFTTLPFAVTDDTVTRPRFELHYEELERMLLQLGPVVDVIDIQSTAPGMHVIVDAGGGPDSISATVPTAAQLTLNGGTEDDSVELAGTGASEEVSVSAGFGSADLNLIGIENATLDLGGGTDVLAYHGVAGVDEQVAFGASTSPGIGTLHVAGLLDLAFLNTEVVDLLANVGDSDEATFIGTDEIDEFFINLAAEGTLDDPVLKLFSPGAAAPLLALRDYRNFGTLNILAGDGADVLNVFVAPAGPGSGRNLFIDGGEPIGPGNPKDELNIFYEMPKPAIQKDIDQLLGVGTVDLDYGLHQFFIEFESIEKVKVVPDPA